MKIRNYIYLLLAGSTIIASCKKSFLDLKPPAAVDAATAIKTESDMGDAVNGMFNAMRQSTFLGRDIPVLADVMSDNVYVSASNSGRYLQENAFTFIATNGEANNIWTQGYYTILQANRIINKSLPSTANVNYLRGEAFTARALAYLELVNLYATPYTVNSSADGVPLVTVYHGAFTKPARSKVSDVYVQIIADLDSAYNIMPTTYQNSEYLSKYATKAIEARAYLYQGNYASARDAAQTVITNSGFSLIPVTSLSNSAFLQYWANPAANSSKQETMFELALTNITNNGTNGLDYIYSPAGYGDLYATDELVKLFTASDARRSLIKGAAGAYTNNKYSNVTNGADKDDVKVIRYAEVLLAAAEGYARTGDEVNALKYLNQLAKARDPLFVGYASTGVQLISDILAERRKELAFEGLRYFDLTRLNVAFTRPAQANSAPAAGTIAIDNFRRILPIPQAETDANKNITQNPGY